MKLAPRDGMVIINPATSKPLQSGDDVEMGSYWVRRLQDGDVRQVEEQSQPAAAQPRARRRTRTKGTEEGK
jgi:hypothetical protein